MGDGVWGLKTKGSVGNPRREERRYLHSEDCSKGGGTSGMSSSPMIKVMSKVSQRVQQDLQRRLRRSQADCMCYEDYIKIYKPLHYRRHNDTRIAVSWLLGQRGCCRVVDGISRCENINSNMLNRAVCVDARNNAFWINTMSVQRSGLALHCYSRGCTPANLACSSTSSQGPLAVF